MCILTFTFLDSRRQDMKFRTKRQQAIDKERHNNYVVMGNFSPPWHYSPSGPWPTSMKLSVSLRSFFLNLNQSVGLLGRVISSSQGLYLYTNIEKSTDTNTKHPCPEWDSNTRSRLPSERRQYMP
jgi:hypothetical protein